MAIDWLDTVVVAGFWGFDICVGHFTIGGEPDSSYGTDGLAFLAPDPSYRSLAADVAIDGSGKAVVVGTVYNTGDDTNAVVARFTTGGVLDSTFNSDGYWAMDLKSSSDDYAAGVVVDSQGRVYMGCHASGGGYGSDKTAVLVRLTTSGALDYNFNGTGKSSNPVTGENMYACGVALDPWEQPLMAGYFGSSTGPYTDGSWLIRFLDNGEPDFNFGGDGLQVVRNAPGNCNIYSLVHPVSGGRALCAGSSEGNPIVTRHRLFALDVGGCLERLLWP